MLWRTHSHAIFTFSVVIPRSYGTMMFVFLGSAAFHATLTYTGQLLDELPMVYGTLMLHHGICTPLWKKKAIPWLILAGVGITALMIVFRDSPLPLQLSYGVLNITLIGRSLLIARKTRPLLDSVLLTSGFVTFTIAFSFWVGKCSLLL